MKTSIIKLLSLGNPMYSETEQISPTSTEKRYPDGTVVKIEILPNRDVLLHVNREYKINENGEIVFIPLNR